MFRNVFLWRAAEKWKRRTLIVLGALGGDHLFALTPRDPKGCEYVELPKVDLTNVSSWQMALRFFQAFTVCIPLLILYPMVYFESYRPYYFALLRKSLEFLGPGFVKLGQWAITRQDLISKDLRKALEPLHDNASQHSATYSKEIIAKELNVANLDVIFSEFDSVPIGSGSIAQVHRARLRESGEEVAVKVRHPHIRERISVDFCCFKAMASLVAPWVDFMDLHEVANQFADNLSVQVDLRQEAQNLERFNANFQHTRGFEFPKPVPELATEKVLVESFIHGEKIDKLATDDIETRRMVTKLGAEMFFQMIITDNYFHADLHPGNFLIGKYCDGKPYLALLDAGITHALSPEDQHVSFRFMQAITLKQPEKLTESFIKMSTCSKRLDEGQLRADVEKLFNDIYGNTRSSWITRWMQKYGYRGQRDPTKVTELFNGAFTVARNNHLQLRASFCSLLFSSIMLEDVCNTVDPGFDLEKCGVPWLLSNNLLKYLGLERKHAYVFQ